MWEWLVHLHMRESTVSGLDLEFIVRPSNNLSRKSLDRPRGKRVSAVVSVLTRLLDAVRNRLLVIARLLAVAEPSAHHTSAA